MCIPELVGGGLDRAPLNFHDSRLWCFDCADGKLWSPPRKIAEDTEIPRVAILWSISSMSDGAAAIPLTRAEVLNVLVAAPMVIPTWGFSKSALRYHLSRN